MTRNDLGDRQRDDLEGRLNHDRTPARVILTASRDVAATRTGQNLLWMLTNLLARQQDEVVSIEVCLPAGIPVHPGISPLLSPEGDFAELLGIGMRRINPQLGTITSGVTTVAIRVGPGSLPEADYGLYASAAGWSGYTGTHEAAWLPADENPVGAYVATALTAGEAFKFLRSVHPEYGVMTDATWFDAHGMAVVDGPRPGPQLPQTITGVAATLAGVGAVGSAFLHLLYALPQLTATLTAIDGDQKGIELSNLNRYVLFGQDDLGKPKASRVQKMFEGSGVTITSRDLLWQDWIAAYPAELTDLVLSCVDNNKARHAIQDALPRRILSASTFELRAQLVAFERLEDEACLRCHNPLPKVKSDDEVIAGLQAQSSEARAEAALEHQVVPEQLETYLGDPQKHCGLISGETLRKFAGQSGDEWSVGFVSAFAGILLAAEYLKRSLGEPAGRLEGSGNMIRFQFWVPGAAVNEVTHWPQDPKCLCSSDFYRAAIQRA